jgi:hypothetical protein
MRQMVCACCSRQSNDRPGGTGRLCYDERSTNRCANTKGGSNNGRNETEWQQGEQWVVTMPALTPADRQITPT